MSEYQVMPDLTAEEYAELKADIEQRGVMVPIEYDEAGNVLDGYHRLKICGELGIKDFPRVIRAGMTEAEKLTHARKLNMARRHLTQEQKRVLIREQIKATPEQSDRQIAQALGVSPTTVGTARRDMEDKGQLSKLDTSTGTDGKTYPRKPVSVFNPTVSAQRKELEENGDVERFTTSIDRLGREQPRGRKLPATTQNPQATDIETSEHVEAEDFRPCPENTYQQPEPQLNIESGEQAKDVVETVLSETSSHPIEATPDEVKRPHVSYNTGNSEWYTPLDYIELAREVMGSIDLDPASADIAQRVVKADVYYTQETDGLSHEWFGNVWLNPPYASELIVKFVARLISELENIKQAIVLVNNATETEWFGRLANDAMAVCFPKGRVKFYAPDGSTGTPLQGQALLYFGEYKDLFVDKFRRKGWCALLQ